MRGGKGTEFHRLDN